MQLPPSRSSGHEQAKPRSQPPPSRSGGGEQAKPQSQLPPSHSGSHKQAQRFQSAPVAQSDDHIPPHLMASSGIVGSQPGSTTIAPTQKQKQTVASKPEDSSNLSEEDDSHERELALSSSVKGSDFRATTKVHFVFTRLPEIDITLFQSLLKAKAEDKPRKHATVNDLPTGANKNAAWAQLVIPNFMDLILAGEHPWIIADDVIISTLQNVWDHIYSSNLEFTIEWFNVPFELVSHIITIL